MTSNSGRELDLEIDGKSYRVCIEEISGTRARVRVNDKVLEIGIRVPEPENQTTASGSAFATTSPSPSAVARSPVPQTPGKKSLRALMPGVVVRLVASKGQSVSSGDVLLVLEAMKMENEIRSDRSGTISQIHVSVGQQVQTGDALLSFS